MVLELTVVSFCWTFNPAMLLEPGGAVIWALGWSMIALAGLLYLPLWALATFAVVMIAGHNLLDPLVPAQFGRLSGLWNVLHEGGPFKILPGVGFYAAYPLVPWIGVMAAGFAFGAIMQRPRAERQRLILLLGVALTVAFVLIRALNIYGDPHRWSPQSRGAVFTLLSFLNPEKYPPSLIYLLMTLGPALIVLALFDRAGEPGRLLRPVLVFGRVPLFYYLLHIPLIHLLALGYSYARFGGPTGLFTMEPFVAAMTGNSVYPPEYGVSLPVVYAVWAAVVLLLYWPCRWFAELKQRRRDPWLSYF